jgi:succinate dehydrogenase hydrophobic anchor subunit
MMMGSLVAVGLALLLLWRLLLFMYDRKEYAKFINESQNAKWTAVSLLKLRKTKTII